MSAIYIAESDEQVQSCFAVMRQLRLHLDESAFVSTIRRQEAGGYRLAFVEDAGRVCAVAGFRIMDNLAGGRILYVDDLVTDDGGRSRGWGAQLFDWLAARARNEGCHYLELDSGVQRFDAHRFYLARRMAISSHHFRLKL
jgi:GNAT superfamily N-acetyltransferase